MPRFSRLLPLILAILVFSAGCGRTNGDKQAFTGNRLVIVTSFYPMYLHTINVTRGIPGVKVVNMTKPQEGCLHDYSLTANDMETLQKAGVLVVNGAGMEAFLGKVASQLPQLKIVEASRGIQLLKDDSGFGTVENPHVWVSITNAIKQVQNIGRQLSELDPDHSVKYLENAASYEKKLEELRAKMHAELDGIENRNIVTFHEAFPYFAQEFNLNIAAVVEREPGTEPSARELARTIDLVKSLGIRTLFTEPQYSARAAQTIAAETGARIYALDPVVTGEANEDYDAYIRTMENNLKVLKEALQ